MSFMTDFRGTMPSTAPWANCRLLTGRLPPHPLLTQVSCGSLRVSIHGRVGDIGLIPQQPLTVSWVGTGTQQKCV